MRNVYLCLLSILALGTAASTQGTSTAGKRYALPAGVTTEGDPVVMRGGNPELHLTEGGTVPSDGGNYSCWNPPTETEKGSIGYTLAHYDNKESFDGAVFGMNYLGGWKALMEAGYKSIGDPTQPTGEAFIGKSALTFENIGGAQAASWNETWACVQAAHPRRTLSIYKVHFEGNNTTVDIEAGGSISPVTAKKLALDVLAKVRTLDYTAIK